MATRKVSVRTAEELTHILRGVAAALDPAEKPTPPTRRIEGIDPQIGLGGEVIGFWVTIDVGGDEVE